MTKKAHFVPFLYAGQTLLQNVKFYTFFLIFLRVNDERVLSYVEIYFIV